MPNRRLSMRKTKEILRLHFVSGLTRRQIAASCSVARSTVSDYITRAEGAGLDWAAAERMSQAQLDERLFSQRPYRTDRPQPDFATIHQELRKKHVTLQLLWAEYKQDFAQGYQYSQFCELYKKWKRKIDVVLRREHRAGEKLFVDWAGPGVEIVDSKTGEASEAHLFVAVQGASNYTFAEAVLKRDLPAWIRCHVRALEFYGGCPKVLVPDNDRSGVSRACYYDPDLNPTYAEMAAHYQVAVLPARPGKARDKAKVESGVLIVERWILAALRNRTFFSLWELNQAIRELLEELNARPFRKLPGNRIEMFRQVDQPALAPLPAQPYRLAHWKKARVNIDYHVELDRHYYSVPYALVGRRVEIRHTATSVEILHQGQRVASHRRSSVAGGHTTVAEHRPQCHRRYLEWSPSRLVSWGRKIGPSTALAVEEILASRRFPEQGYRACLGLLRLAKAYSEQRLEAACARAVKLRACSYKSVKSILKAGLDSQPLAESQPRLPLADHDNLRGSDYFQSAEEGRHAE